MPTNREKVPVINETNLKTRYIHPILKYFGNDALNEEFTVRYPETTPTQRRLHKDEAQRPNAMPLSTNSAKTKKVGSLMFTHR